MADDTEPRSGFLIPDSTRNKLLSMHAQAVITATKLTTWVPCTI